MIVLRNHRLASILVVAVALRAASAIFQGDVVAAMPGTYDQISYDALARRVLEGEGFTFSESWWPMTRAGEPTAHWSFLYTLYLSAVYALFGPHPLAARLIQAAVAGVAHPWLAWRIGRRVFGASTGLICAGASAIYVYFVYYSGALMTETFYILAVLWALDLTMGLNSPAQRVLAGPSVPEAPRQRPTRPWGEQECPPRYWVAVSPSEGQGHSAPGELRRRCFRHDPASFIGTAKPWLLLGLALGVAVMLRQVILLFVPVLFGWVLWTNRRQTTGEGLLRLRHWRTTIVGLMITTAVLLAIITPWTVRNYAVFGRFVLLNTNSGFAFFWGNHPIHGTDFVPILPTGVYQGLIPPDLRNLDEATLDQALLVEGLRFVVQDPLRYARLSLSRAGDYFEFGVSPESGLISNLSRVLSFGISLPFVLYGLFLSIADRCPRSSLADQGSKLALLYLFIATYSLIHLLSWALIRYRLPVDAILLLFAGLAVLDLTTRLIKGQRRAHGTQTVSIHTMEVGLANRPGNRTG